MRYKRLLHIAKNQNKSAFILGPRGTGKTQWVKTYFPDDIYINLLKASDYLRLEAAPHHIEHYIPDGCQQWIVIDEIQKLPALLNEVHRLIESRRLKFILTGSSARSLRKKGVNLLAGRALMYHMHPLTALEMGEHFDLASALQFGQLPALGEEQDKQHYLESYVHMYLREEVMQERLARSISDFNQFLRVASFSQGSPVNFSAIARDCNINAKVVASYFSILEDLLIGYFLPVFSRRAKRKVVASPKFYYFDAGVYRTLRPKGPLDLPEEITGITAKSLFLQDLRAINDYYKLGYELYYWRTTYGHEVDFIAYGEKGFIAFEIKIKNNIHSKDLKGLKQFALDYPEATLYIIYGGERKLYFNNITAIPFEDALHELPDLLQGATGQR